MMVTFRKEIEYTEMITMSAQSDVSKFFIAIKRVINCEICMTRSKISSSNNLANLTSEQVSKCTYTMQVHTLSLLNLRISLTTTATTQ